MRHDAHYIDELIGKRVTSIGRMISITSIYPNPLQPRIEIGDLGELTESIADKGVLEPLLVQPQGEGRWMIIAGERRWRAATAAGLSEVPCIELDVDDRTVAEIALIENLQRKDLTVWEEAEGLYALSQRFGYTHEEVARKVGKSRSSITECMSIAMLPREIKEKCQAARLNTKSTLLQVVRQPNADEMLKILEVVIERGLTREGTRAARKRLNGESASEVNAKAHVYKFASLHESKIKIEAPLELDTAQQLAVLQHVLEVLRAKL